MQKIVSLLLPIRATPYRLILEIYSYGSKGCVKLSIRSPFGIIALGNMVIEPSALTTMLHCLAIPPVWAASLSKEDVHVPLVPL